MAVKAWVDRELCNEGILYSIDQDGLLSLLLGEPPNPLGSEVAKNHPGVSLERIRDKVIESLRQAIPAELVEDIFVNDVSWTE